MIKDGAIAIEPVPAKQLTTAHTISEAMFYEELAKRDAQSPQRLKIFLAELAPLGVYTELGRTLSMKLDLPNRSKPVSLGYVTRTGQVWTESVVKTAPGGAGEAYLHALASVINGQIKPGPPPYVTTNGKSGPYLNDLLPAHADAWQRAIEAVVAAGRDAA